MYTLELTEAERNFLLACVEKGLEAMGISTVISKLRGIQAPAPAPVVEAPVAQ